MNTIYECHKPLPNCYSTIYSLVCCKTTEQAAILWLEDNGGGIYKNVLHKFQINIRGKQL